MASIDLIEDFPPLQTFKSEAQNPCLQQAGKIRYNFKYLKEKIQNLRANNV